MLAPANAAYCQIGAIEPMTPGAVVLGDSGGKFAGGY
jgi:hypothetical protein